MHKGFPVQCLCSITGIQLYKGIGSIEAVYPLKTNSEYMLFISTVMLVLNVQQSLQDSKSALKRAAVNILVNSFYFSVGGWTLNFRGKIGTKDKPPRVKITVVQLQGADKRCQGVTFYCQKHTRVGRKQVSTLPTHFFFVI